MSPELEALDQLLSGDLPLRLVRTFFDHPHCFIRAIVAMLEAREVTMIATDGTDVPRWRWRDVLESSDELRLSITQKGSQRVA